MIRTRIIALLALALCLMLPPTAPLCAQSQPASAAAQPAPVSADELERLVNTLQDEKGRAKLVEELRGLIAAQRGIEQEQEAETPATWLNTISGEIDAISGEILATAAVVVDAPYLIGWFQNQIGDAAARTRWLEIALKLGIVFAAAVIGEWLLRMLLARPTARVGGQSSETPLAQALLLLILLVLEALPIIGFAVFAYFVLPLVQPQPIISRIAEIIIDASLTARLILIVVQVSLVSPNAATLHALGEETRNYLYIWARRFTGWAVYGYALAAATWELGVPGAIYTLILRGTMLVLGILSVIFVLQNRAPVAEFLRGKPRPEGQNHGWRLLRSRLADTWHILAIAYLGATFGTYVLRVEGGLLFVLRATMLSLVILLAAGIIVRSARRLSQRGFAIRSDLKARFPTLETRANRYLPVLTAAVAVIVYFFAALALALAWGFNAFAWFETSVGRKFTGSALSIATVMLVALVIWELFGSAIERYLSGVSADGRPVARSARVRTLLPLLRTVVFILLATVVGLIVLDEFGVNIAPLLAGAGVIGIAIGFGSQALVKDVITGLFMLLEDTLAVGEVVDVGKDHSGVVEAISIRAIKLRDAQGTLHTVPFSEVSTVRNMTRDYSYVVADIGVLYREDPDRVIGVLREVADQLRKDAEWRPFITEPLDVVGLDRFTDSAVVIRVRLKTPPLKQWAVGREFNRRVKKAFDAHGIEMPAMNQTHYLEPQPEEHAAAEPAAAPVKSTA